MRARPLRHGHRAGHRAGGRPSARRHLPRQRPQRHAVRLPPAALGRHPVLPARRPARRRHLLRQRAGARAAVVARGRGRDPAERRGHGHLPPAAARRGARRAGLARSGPRRPLQRVAPREEQAARPRRGGRGGGGASRSRRAARGPRRRHPRRAHRHLHERGRLPAHDQRPRGLAQRGQGGAGLRPAGRLGGRRRRARARRRRDPRRRRRARPRGLGAALAAVLREPRRSNGHEAIEAIGTRRIAERIVAVYRRLARRPVAGTP